jgi:hypothetical protein
VAEEVEEEGIVPSCALELGPQGGFCVGLSASDVESEAPENGEIGWTIVPGQASSHTFQLCRLFVIGPPVRQADWQRRRPLLRERA